MSDDYDDGWGELLELLNDWSNYNEEKFFIAPDGYKFEALEVKRLLKIGLDPNSGEIDCSQKCQYRDEIIDALRTDLDRDPDEFFQYLEDIQEIYQPISNVFAYPLAEFGEWILEGDVDIIVYDSSCESIQEGKVVKLN